MIPPWFRVPVQLIQSEPEEARGWIYLLGQWHIGATPGHNEIRRALGWGAGRVQRFIPKVAKWALLHGATVPEEVAEHFRSSSGAVAEQQRSGTGAGQPALIEDNQEVSEQQRSTTGANAEQQRSDSRAGDPFREIKRERREEKEGEGPLQQPQKQSPPEHPGPSGGVSGRPASPESNQGQASPVSGPSEGKPAEGDLLPLLMSHLAGGHAVQVARKLYDAGVSTVADAGALDEFNVSQIVGSQCKVGTLKALRAGGWVPPKERTGRPPIAALPPPGVKQRTLFARIGKEEENGHQRRAKGAS